MYEFRNDYAFGDGVRDAVSVIAYEVFELGNMDSIEYILNNYKISKDIALKWQNILDEMEHNDEENGCPYATNDNGYKLYPESEEVFQLVRQLLDEVSKCKKTDIQEVLWLASEKSVRKRYSGDDDNIEAYDVSSGVVLSDLGFDGKLYGFHEIPVPVPFCDLKKDLSKSR